MSGKLIGGPELRARLASLADVPDQFAQTWADDTKQRIEATIPTATHHPESRVFEAKSGTGPVGEPRGGVYGAFWWIFVDRGHKRIEPKKDTFLALKGYPGQTIFAKKTKAQPRRPFITAAAQAALASSDFADTIIKQWNGKRLVGRHIRFLP